MGTITNGIPEADIHYVRDYGGTRHAVYIDPYREMLFAFPTDMSNSLADAKMVDVKSYSDTGEVSEGSNEIPDDYEKTKLMRKNRSSRYRYQLAIYNIAAERAAGFPFRALADKDDTTADTEQRWLYFTLNNADGYPDSDESVRNLDVKNYRTNFYEAKPNPLDRNSFYVSHRGANQSEHANNIIKVSIVADPFATAAPDAAGGCPSGYHKVADACIPLTPNYLKFDRVYGFNGEVDALHYPSDFDVKLVKGQQLLVVNHFRDRVNWAKDQQRYSLTSKVLDQSFWRSDLNSLDYNKSYYQIAVNQNGIAMTCSFYGESVILLKMYPGEAVEEIKQIY